MTTLFISDLHLSEQRPDITALFQAFLHTEARQSDALYILGDLFDAWIGDDDLTPFHLDVIQSLRQLTDAGVPVYFIAGNRDFVIGKRFAAMTGVQILAESVVVDLYGTPTLLMHGDTLCTRDVSYLRFRKIIRNPVLLALLTRLPLSWRRGIAARLRGTSKTKQPLNAEQLEKMDATEEGVQAALAKQPARRIIHGHTHRPGVHPHHVSGLGARPVERIVLGDWYEQGSVLSVDATGFNLQSRPLPQPETLTPR